MTAIPHPKHPCPPKCPKRTGECKITCEKWQGYEEEYKEFEKQKRAEIEHDEAILEYKRDRRNSYIRKMQKENRFKRI